MTQWGMLLLCVYIALGLSRVSWRTAGRLALVVTVVVIGAAIVGYKHSGPPLPSWNVGGTPADAINAGRAVPPGTAPSTESTAGRSQEVNNVSTTGTSTTPGTTPGQASGSGS
jgi:hypothetical protein